MSAPSETPEITAAQRVLALADTLGNGPIEQVIAEAKLCLTDLSRCACTPLCEQAANLANSIIDASQGPMYVGMFLLLNEKTEKLRGAIHLQRMLAGCAA